MHAFASCNNLSTKHACISFGNNKQLLHTPPLNTMNYLHKVVDEAKGRVKYSLPRVDNHGIQWRGVCNNSFIIHLHRISGEKKIMMKKGKKLRRKENEGEKSVTQTWLDLNSVPLGCEESI